MAYSSNQVSYSSSNIPGQSPMPNMPDMPQMQLPQFPISGPDFHQQALMNHHHSHQSSMLQANMQSIKLGFHHQHQHEQQQITCEHEQQYHQQHLAHRQHQEGGQLSLMAPGDDFYDSSPSSSSYYSSSDDDYSSPQHPIAEGHRRRAQRKAENERLRAQHQESEVHQLRSQQATETRHLRTQLDAEKRHNAQLAATHALSSRQTPASAPAFDVQALTRVVEDVLQRHSVSAPSSSREPGLSGKGVRNVVRRVEEGLGGRGQRGGVEKVVGGPAASVAKSSRFQGSKSRGSEIAAQPPGSHAPHLPYQPPPPTQAELSRSASKPVAHSDNDAMVKPNKHRSSKSRELSQSAEPAALTLTSVPRVTCQPSACAEAGSSRSAPKSVAPSDNNALVALYKHSSKTSRSQTPSQLVNVTLPPMVAAQTTYKISPHPKAGPSRSAPKSVAPSNNNALVKPDKNKSHDLSTSHSIALDDHSALAKPSSSKAPARFVVSDDNNAIARPSSSDSTCYATSADAIAAMQLQKTRKSSAGRSVASGEQNALVKPSKRSLTK